MSYPLRFRPLYKSVLWGGRKLQQLLGRELPIEGPVGESWELADFDDAATGRSYSSVIDNGPLAGRTLREAITRQPERILGPGRGPEPFPLLIKFIDARENLSVQVHPNNAACARLGLPARPKTECWYIMHADPGASIYRGLRPGVSVADFAAAVREGRAVAELLNREPVSADETYLVPAGTVHAIGAGVLLAEVQQASDTTYRLWDWDRLDPATGQPRELHLDVGLSCIEPVTLPPAMRFTDQSPRRRQTLVNCQTFRLEELRTHTLTGASSAIVDSWSDATDWPIRSAHTAQVWIVVAGRSTLTCSATAAGEAGVITLTCGQVMLLPRGSCEAGWRWGEPSADLRLLVATPVG